MNFRRETVIALLLACPAIFAAEPEQLFQLRDSYPQLSPDGEQLVFQSNRDGSNQIWLMNRDGSEPRQLTTLPDSGAETPNWSPDGEFITFAAYTAEGNNDVFVIRVDGSGMRQITDGPGYDGHPHWSVDGSRIVFNSDRDTPSHEVPWERRWHDIWSVAPDGSDLEKHTDCRTVCTYGSLSPDGQQLVYRRVDDSDGLNWVHELGPRNSEIYVAEADGTGARVLVSHPAFDGWPAWSPDGQWIVFASNRGERNLSGQLWLVRPGGSELGQLTSGDWGHVQPAWGWDSRWLSAFRFQELETVEYGGIFLIPLPES